MSGHQWPTVVISEIYPIPCGRPAPPSGRPRWTHSPPRARGAALDGSASAGCGIRSSRWKATWQAAGRTRPSCAPPPAKCERWTQRTSSVASGTQRVIRGPSEGHQRAIRGPSEGHQRQSMAVTCGSARYSRSRSRDVSAERACVRSDARRWTWSTAAKNASEVIRGNQWPLPA
jgi:hypothetical protein